MLGEYGRLHITSSKKEVAFAFTVTGTKAGDRVKLRAKCLGNSTLNPVSTLADDYISDRCLLQQVVNVPVQFFISFKMMAQPGFKPIHG